MARGARAAVLGVLTLAALGAGPETPADFKLRIGLYEAAAEPRSEAEMVVRGGRAYQFLRGSKEVIVFDRPAAEVQLLDLERAVRSDLSFGQLDATAERLRHVLRVKAASLETSDDKADRVAARMTRDLIEPDFTATFDAEAHRLRLTNGSVEVEARGVPDDDPARVAVVGELLTRLAQLGALRNPSALPPFTRIDAIAALVQEHHLRPTELSFLYRLAGRPVRLRWTVELVPELTDREREALDRVDVMRLKVPPLPLDQYDIRARPPDQEPGPGTEAPDREKPGP